MNNHSYSCKANGARLEQVNLLINLSRFLYYNHYIPCTCIVVHITTKESSRIRISNIFTECLSLSIEVTHLDGTIILTVL